MSADDRSTWLAFGAIVLATGIAVAVVAAVREVHPPQAPRPAASAEPVVTAPPPVVAPEPPAIVPAAVVPPEILATSSRRADPRAPGLLLLATKMSGSWEARRAEVKDLESGAVRDYAIGDLLPHGSLLVGLSTGSADVLVADRTLVRLSTDGSLAIVEDFRTADEGSALKVVPDRDAPYRAGALEALLRVRGDDAEDAQRAVDELIDAGDPVIEVIIPHVDSLIPMPERELYFPSTGERHFVPAVEGDVVVAVLERITGQTFGDVSRPKLELEERRKIFSSWLRWWGL